MLIGDMYNPNGSTEVRKKRAMPCTLIRLLNRNVSWTQSLQFPSESVRV